MDYVFYRENKVDGKFTLNIPQLRGMFINWMKKQEKAYLEYYCFHLVRAFVSDKDGLNSVMDERSDYEALSDSLQNVKWEYLKSIGVN